MRDDGCAAVKQAPMPSEKAWAVLLTEAFISFFFQHERPPQQSGAQRKKEDGEPRKVSGQRGGDQRGAELEDDILNETGHVVPNVVLNAQIGFAFQAVRRSGCPLRPSQSRRCRRRFLLHRFLRRRFPPA